MLTGAAPQNGVSLLELVIAMVIIAMLFTFVAPSFATWIQNLQIRTAAESIQNGLQLARTEAVRRNDLVRFSLTDATGLPSWQVGCVNISATCPSPIQSYSSAEGANNALVGISTVTPSSPVPANQYATAISGGAGLPAGVTFNGLGRMPTANVGADFTRADITNKNNVAARRLVVIVTSGGFVRLCDPALSVAANPQGCS